LHEPYNSKVDVYSFAMICYQMFEAMLPFEGTDPIQAAKHAAMYKTRPFLEPMAPQVPHREIRQVRTLCLVRLDVQSCSCRTSRAIRCVVLTDLHALTRMVGDLRYRLCMQR
jgi:serine/threonine protein kinase